MTRTLLEARGLTKVYASRARGPRVPAVDGVSFAVAEGGAVGIAGESGSGKTTLARMVLRLVNATAGALLFDGRDVAAAPERDLRDFRRQVQAVFQDSGSALSPRMRVRDIIAEPLAVQEPRMPAADVDARVDHLLERVGLARHLRASFPHQLSGGQKQRVAIARALILRPRLLVLDEPVSALDVSIRSQVLNLLLDLQEEYGLAYLMIAHDLAVLRHVTRDLVVVYRGRVVEAGPTDDVLRSPQHPYTRALIDAVPRLAGTPSHRHAIAGDDASAPAVAGCAFAPRCPRAFAPCLATVPGLRPVTTPPTAHHAACHAHALAAQAPTP